MSRLLSYRGLQAFRLMMLTGSVSTAAATMNLSQPAVSRLLKDLELDTGLALFDRTRGRLVPTAEADLLLEEVQRSFVGLERIAGVASEIRNGRRGSLSIGAMPALCNTILPRIVADFLEEAPGVSVRLDAMSSLTVTQHVLTGLCDVGFVTSMVPAAGLAFERRWSVASCCILPAGHRLADREVIGPEDFAGENVVALSASTLMGTEIQALFDRHGVSRSTRTETPLSSLVSAMVLEGIGIGIVDAITGTRHRELGGVVRPFEPVVRLDMAMVRRHDGQPNAAHPAFLAACDRHLADYAVD